MRFRTRSGLAIGYRTRGRGPLIAMLHPVGLRAAFWDPVAECLEGDFRVIAIDTRGHGDSDVPGAPFTLDDVAADVIELLHAIGRPSCAVLGCSMGGMIAQGVALQAPDLVAALLLSNTSHSRTPQARQALLQRAATAELGMPDILRTTIDRWFSKDYQAAHPDIVGRATDWLLTGDPVVHAWSWRAMADLAYGARFGEIRCPALVLSGADDQSVSSAASQSMTDALAGARRHDFPGAGHLTPMEQPEQYARVVKEFLQGLPAFQSAQA